MNLYPYLEMQETHHSLSTPKNAPRLRGLVLILALLVTLGFSSTAQEAQQITFEEAVRIALEQNVQLRQTQNSVALAESGVMSSKGQFLPNLNASGSASARFGLQFDQVLGELVTRRTEGLNVGLSSGIDLFQGWANVAGLKQANLDLDAANQDLTRARQVVLFTVVNDYLNLILDREQVVIQQQNLTSQQQLLERIQEFTNVGSRPISELYQQQASVARAERALLNAERSVQLNELRLVRTLQLDPNQEYDFQAPEATDGDILVEDLSLEEMIDIAFDRRTDLKAAEFRLRADEQQIRIAKANGLPSLTLGANGGTDFSSGITDRATGDVIGLGDQFGDNRSGRIGLDLRIPIFNRFQVKAGVQRAEIAYQNAQIALENEKHAIGLEVRQAYLDYLTNAKDLEVSAKELEFSELALQSEQERYNVGASTLVDLSQQQTAFVQAASDQATARYRFLAQKRLIEYFLGTIDPETTTIFGQ